ncbi:hypothetical protein EV130_101747 [Rhizobium azibense]|uniref:Uncharacterized protein n=1 Tax=Rhizobium azibense TaxID=1136135 RepID=A0A4R3S0W1_9HYPH|nr:hypothetical protein EV130_101747 [Rhizobium azibense]TCU40817.1 hypothetical protein EV129_101102 [Rhizobium azibense]
MEYRNRQACQRQAAQGRSRVPSPAGIPAYPARLKDSVWRQPAPAVHGRGAFTIPPAFAGAVALQFYLLGSRKVTGPVVLAVVAVALVSGPSAAGCRATDPSKFDFSRLWQQPTRIGTKEAGAMTHSLFQLRNRRSRLLRGFLDQPGDELRLRDHHDMGSTRDHDCVLGACPLRHESKRPCRDILVTVAIDEP